MDDASRRALRDLARRAEWRGRAGAAGAAQDADTLRQLGGDLRAALARDDEQDAASWGFQSVVSLAAYCLKARADWTPEQIAELARLREDAVIALAPGPGESDALPQRDARASLASLGSRQARLVAFAIGGCAVLIALVVLVPHVFSNSGGAQPVAAASTTAAPADTATTPASSPTTSSSNSATPTTTADPATATSSPSATATTAPSTARVTAIQLTNTDYQAGSPPEVYLTYSVTATSTEDVYIEITVDGTVPTELASQEPIDESGLTTYPDLTQRIDLSAWCGKTVKIAISSGSAVQTASVAVTGC
ncbi:hypothetical protein KDK95_20030 [Actinospica sp. MGRD01-02]|uniref:Uncharacterized protein n=1 Tax=Actinospica acidithermotolerans TaxID=2828514 RepID=A0A941EGD7_9ACTN|nr:hypothetical protein [Actinospica acidithermotolerans]MBR7828609.1 hypothetical protein [Actinospica acidithermotolerans]